MCRQHAFRHAAGASRHARGATATRFCHHVLRRIRHPRCSTPISSALEAKTKGKRDNRMIKNVLEDYKLLLRSIPASTVTVFVVSVILMNLLGRH